MFVNLGQLYIYIVIYRTYSIILDCDTFNTDIEPYKIYGVFNTLQFSILIANILDIGS